MTASNETAAALTTTRTRGPYTWTVPAKHVFDVETFGYGVWTIRETHGKVEQAKHRASFRVRTNRHATRKNVRIRPRLVAC